MDFAFTFSSLPYEIQFKYLAGLSYEDTINYCGTGTIAYTICQTKAFWKYKAQIMFGIDLDVISYGLQSGAQKYQKLKELYTNRPELLIIYLVDAEQLSQLPLLFGRLSDIEKVNILSEVLSILVEKDSRELMEDIFVMFKKVLQEAVDNNNIENIMRTAYFEALLNNKMDLVNILKRYYDPNMDNSEYVYEWLHQWKFEAHPATIASLTAAGVSFERLDE